MTFMERELPKLYQKTKGRVFAVTDACGYFALTTDCWSSRANESFIGITFHSITKDWDLESFTLDNRELSVSHTAENLAQALKAVLIDCSLDESHISAATVDNAANIQKAVRDVQGWKCLGCFGHTINLCVKVGLKQHKIQTTVSRCSRLVTYFRKSTQAATLLASKQEALGMKKHKLLQDVETRWNSTYDMIQRVMEQQAAICAALLEQKRMDLLPKDNELKLLEDIIDVLKPFKDVTEQMSGQSYVTVSTVHPILHFIESSVLQPLDSGSK